jgi:hypothetical protein
VKSIAVLLFAVAGAACTAALAFAAQSPKQLQTAILSAALAQQSVHYVQVGSGKSSGRMVCDVANDRGIQRIAITKGGKNGHVTVRVVNHTAYIRGDAVAMHRYMGFSVSEASRYHDRWISIPRGYPTYRTVAAAVTLPSFVHQLRIPGSSLTSVSGTLAGRKVVGVRRTGKFEGLEAVETLYARAHGTRLPVELLKVAHKKGYRDTVVMTHWNEKVLVTAPAHSVPITTVVGG